MSWKRDSDASISYLCNITLFITSFQRKGLVGLGLNEADASGENMEGDDVAHGFNVSPFAPPLF